MPFANLSIPAFPDVPITAGVPALLRAVGTVVPAPILASADATGLIDILGGRQWGVFDADGVAVIIGDNVMGFDFRKEYRKADYPIEDGDFRSYNKVLTPFDARMTFTFSGKSELSAIAGGLGNSAGARGESLAALDAASASLSLYTAVSPEVSYPNCTINHYDYRRTAKNGATLLTIDVWLEEVRQAPNATFTQTKTDSSTPAVSTGTVQAAPAATDRIPEPA